MKKKVFNMTVVAFVFITLCMLPTSAQNPFLVATDYVPADGKTDATEAIQALIDANPNRTIVFPDGTYLISRSILTPADPRKSVHLVLANYAIFKATGDWKEGGAIIRLGASSPANNISTPGSNYGMYGGIIDGSGIADGISIDGGRETRIENVSIKQTQVGIHIKLGANGGSSDADINNVNIVGNNSATSIGLLVEGNDNTFSNMRIAYVNTGVWLKRGGGGNSLRNIHPLYISGPDQQYETSCGFVVESYRNWFNFCYSDQFATGFKLQYNTYSNLTDCFCYWYSGKVPFQTAIESSEGNFNSIVTGFQMGFHEDCKTVTLLKGQKGGKGVLQNLVMPTRKLSDEDVSADYVK